VKKISTRDKRALLMEHRKAQLHLLIHVYYQERGWDSEGIPLPETLKGLGLWEYLNEEARIKISELTS
jgi:aldehyde:ferredoxin oxidoreductase